ncbi:MAG: M23 family metallopeptidase [Candidatus Marinimicrobia bacterium]|nr:M23 family metallopeptidase [Candidatus Neomarinimicrobiota bacterium]
MKTDKVTFIYVPLKGGEQRTLTLHHRLFTLIKVVLLICLLLLIISYGILIPRANKYTDYKDKINTYKAQETQLRQLLENVNEMKQFNTYMRELLGLELTSGSSSDYSALIEASGGQQDEQFLSGCPELAPAKGLITKKFMSGPRKHYGIDIGGKIGDPILASAAGLVVFAGWTPELGNMVVILHADDYITVYGHNDRLNVQERQRVKKGDLIALLGETGYSMGPHLHFEVWHHGLALDPQTVILEYKNKN